MKRLLVVAAAIALVPLAAPGPATAGGGCHGDYVPDAKSVEVTFSEMCMDPMVTRIPVKGTVRWTNKDPMVHNIMGAAFQWGSDGELRTNETISFRFDRAGTFPYACTLHPGMIGAVVVGTGVTPAGAAGHNASVTRVASGTRSSAPSADPASEEPTAEPVSAEPTADPAAAEPSEAAALPSVQTPPSAQPKAIAATPVASRSNDNSGVILAGFAFIGALILGAVAFLARRTPPAPRELIG